MNDLDKIDLMTQTLPLPRSMRFVPPSETSTMPKFVTFGFVVAEDECLKQPVHNKAMNAVLTNAMQFFIVASLNRHQ